MLRIIQRCWDRLRPTATSARASETTVLLVRVPVQQAAAAPLPPDVCPPERPAPVEPSRRRSDTARPAERSPTANGPPSIPLSNQPPPRASQPPSPRQASQDPSQGPPAAVNTGELTLRALGLFSPKMLGKLRRAGLRSAADLLAADPQRVVKRIGVRQHWVAKLRRCQRAIRFSNHFSEMTPHEALLLFAAHRRSPTRLAGESAGVLKRDLERLLLSSRGQKLAAGRPVPELARVRVWIREAQTKNERRKLRNRKNPSPRAEKPADRPKSTALAAGPAQPN